MVYTIEYAKSDRSTCKGPKSECISKTHHISKGELRLGVEVTLSGHHTVAWRHWLCTTPKVLENMKEAMSGPEEIEGFNTLKDEDREQIQTAWDNDQLPDKEEKPKTSDSKEKTSSDKADKDAAEKTEKNDKQSTKKTKKDAEPSAKTKKAAEPSAKTKKEAEPSAKPKKKATPKAEPTRRSPRVKQTAAVEASASPAKKRAAAPAATKSKATTAGASTKRAKKN